MTQHRPHAPAISRKTNTHITHSDFGKPEADPIPIPRGLGKLITHRVRVILEQNPHIVAAQMSAVVRLAQLEEKFKDLKRVLDEEDWIIEDRFGGKKKHPAAELLLQVQASIVRQEHGLAISVPARNQNIPKSDEKMRRGGPRPGTKKNSDGTTSPVLKLA